ncbi:hypothetical protein NQ314_002463 [Rhamnusium bicolor]|uniref:Uncharacterized protein n=1 Tax=Rhamnusium bicolor TaxID=1586634 RepID=A0AAV8ZSJ0_9CUCU|nr:hypothetical protein NQ314_002463 [Rhamnusium bicolor]
MKDPICYKTLEPSFSLLIGNIYVLATYIDVPLKFPTMFAYVRYIEDNVCRIISTDKIAKFDVSNIKWDKKYSVEWEEDGEYYPAQITVVKVDQSLEGGQCKEADSAAASDGLEKSEIYDALLRIGDALCSNKRVMPCSNKESHVLLQQENDVDIGGSTKCCCLHRCLNGRVE